jgi:hypothetical protein
VEQGEGSATAQLSSERIDLGRAAGPVWIAWTAAAVGSLVALVVTLAVTLYLFRSGFLAIVPALGWLYLVSWWRVRRMCRALPLVEGQAGTGRLRLRVRSARSIWLAWLGSDTELTIADGWVLLGDQRWPAASVALGREPSFWSARPVELLTPSGPVGISAVPKGDVGMYLGTLVDRELRPILARLLAAQSGAGPTACGWYPDPWNPAAWRWWDGVAWSGHSV